MRPGGDKVPRKLKRVRRSNAVEREKLRTPSSVTTALSYSEEACMERDSMPKKPPVVTLAASMAGGGAVEKDVTATDC